MFASSKKSLLDALFFQFLPDHVFINKLKLWKYIYDSVCCLKEVVSWDNDTKDPCDSFGGKKDGLPKTLITKKYCTTKNGKAAKGTLTEKTEPIISKNLWLNLKK